MDKKVKQTETIAVVGCMGQRDQGRQTLLWTPVLKYIIDEWDWSSRKDIGVYEWTDARTRRLGRKGSPVPLVL